MMNRVWKLALATSIVPVALFGQKQSGWNSLPEDTVFAMNVDFSSNITDKIQKETKLGKNIFSQAKIEKFKEVIKKHSDQVPGIGKFFTELKEAGLEFDDIFKIMNNKLGMGVVPEKFGKQNYLTFMMWVDFDDEVVMNKLHTVLVEKMGKDQKRVDFEINGDKIIHVFDEKEVSNVMFTKIGKRFVFVVNALMDKGASELTEEDLKSLQNILQKQSGSSSLILQPLQNEFVEGGEKKVLSAVEGKVREGMSELLKVRMAQFMMAQKGDGGEFAAKMNSKLGTEKIRPAGESIVELYLDVEKIYKFTEVPMAELAQFGVDKLSAVFVGMALDSNKLNSSFFMASPTPRIGVMSLIDQQLIDPLPPEWVPENVLNYAQVSFNMKSLYNVIKEIASVKLGAEAFQNQELQANQMMAGVLGTDIQGLIGSFGTKFYKVGFGFDTVATAPDAEKVIPVEKAAYVFEFNNEQVMKRIFDSLAPAIAGQGAVRSQEQGFDGFRMTTPQGKFAIFYGFKKMVMCTGEGTAENILASIANPPKGEDSLFNSKKFNALLKSENIDKTMLFSYDDSSSLMTMLYTTMSKVMTREMILSEIEDEKERALMSDLLELVPTLEEVEGVFGTGYTIGKPVDSGLTIKSSLTLP